MKKVKYLFVLLLLVALPLNALAVNGRMRLKYKEKGGNVVITFQTIIKSGHLTKYTTDITESKGLEFVSINGLAVDNVTHEEGIITMETLDPVAGETDVFSITFKVTDSANWNIKLKDSQFCEGETCVKVYNNDMKKGSTTGGSSGTIKNPKTAVTTSIGAGLIILGAAAVYYLSYKDKKFSNI